jgi:Ca2+-binding RTX toxin-like protein
MKSFAITLDDLLFLEAQVNVPIIQVVRYQVDGAPIYGYTVPQAGFHDPVTGAALTRDPFKAGNPLLPIGGATVELGTIGTFDVFNTAWSLFLPPVVTANGITAAGVGEPFGLRNVQGLFNNIALSSSAIWGAAFYAFARTSDAEYGNYLQQRTSDPAFKAQTDVSALTSNSFSTSALWSSLSAAQKSIAQGNTNYGVVINSNDSVDLTARYANPFLTVYDYSPRMISQLVDSHDALLRVDTAAGGGIITDRAVTYDLTDINTGATTSVTESFARNLNTLSGDPSLTGWNTLFGQFFDHGLDAIGKGGNTVNGVSSKIYIPLDPTDPLYRAPGTNGVNDPGYTKLSISRATVANPEAAGADGMFRTADDIQSPGADGLYGTADDVLGPTNPNYINHTSPYIDQSQTYGSDDTTTNLLREWVQNPTTGKYTPGMYLFDGNTLANAWNEQHPDGTVTATHKTLPTLNELRAYLRSTGRDDLSWEDINNLRVRDASGKVLDLDPNTAGIQAKLTGHTLLADFLPRLDAAHINAAGLTAMATLFPSYSGNIADYVDLNSGQPTALGNANPGILSELLLRSIGDHYVAGDGRANENFGLTAIHHVWHENHNWQIDNLKMIIGQQQAADPTHTVAHKFQVNTGLLDAQGNYKYANGTIAWDQEKMFQAATLINQGEYQHVAIDQYARGMSPNIPLFVQYDSGVNVDVTLDYSQGAFRFGHSQLRETIDALDPLGSLTNAVTHYALEQAFLNPAGFAKVGPTAIAQGMTRQFSNEIDEFITPSLQQKLLGQPQDLAAINIARGRDLGLPTLNNLRRALSGGLSTELTALQQKLQAHPGDATLQQTIDKTIVLQAGLQAYSSWADFGNHIQHPESLANFIAAYSFNGDLDKATVLTKLADGTTFSSLTAAEKTIVNSGLGWNESSDLGYSIKASQFINGGDTGYEAIDAWNGGLAETHVYLGELGSTFDAIFADQMTRLINGDRFYYFWRFQLGLPTFTDLNSAIATEQFKDVIERTTGAQHLVGNVFFGADSYVEVGEAPKDLNALGDNILGADRDHKYGDLLAPTKTSRTNYDGTTTSLLDVSGQHIGVASIGGSSETLNGYVIERITGKTVAGGNIVENFILDVRPDKGVNPDGTAAIGFNSHEVIGGTQFRDYIDAGDGDDTIYGGGGNDILIGNAGADHIYGEAGDDLIYGGTLPDFLDGGIGNDEIHGGDDADVLIGAEGNDKLFGENFTDELHGGAGDDYLDGGLDADFIYGGTGQDVVVGGEGLDTTYGEGGDDRMFGGAGPDQLFGGYGDDILNPGFGGQNQNVNVDEALGEFGFNIVSFSDIGNIPLNHSADLNQQNVNISNVTPFGQLWVNINGIEGSSSNDTIIGYVSSVGAAVDPNLLNNWMFGGGGNDTITTGAGDDVIVGDSVRLDALVGSYQKDISGNYVTDANGAYILQRNGILDFAYGAAAAPSKHFLDLLKSVPDFTFGDTVTLGTAGIIYTHQAVLGNDKVLYAGNRANFTIAEIFNPANPGTVLGYKIVDVTGVETGTKGDIVLGVEKFSFNGTVLTAAQLISNGSVQVSGYASANQPNASLFQLAAAVTDINGISNPIGYQWQFSTNGGVTWQSVAGASSSTFKPVNPTVGNNLVPLGASIRVVADYVDTIGALEHVVSTATQPMGRYVSLTGAGNTAINLNNVAGAANNNSSTDYQDVLFGNSGNNVINAGGGNDYINGAAGNDTLNGGTGADTMLGGLGNDTYVVDDLGDVVIETPSEGTDLVQSSITYSLTDNVEALTLTGTAAINGAGNALDNTLNGNSGNNILDGGVGADRMSGGLGDDTYIVDNAGDVISEAANAGTDTVQSSISWTLGNNLENLILTGVVANGTGNGLNNVLTGNSGDNILDGKGGTDTMVGGLGNDTYIVDNAGDLIVENLNEGTDTVQASVTYTLSANVENLTLTNNNSINGTGNALDNVLTGSRGNNILDGGLGADTMIGGVGNDTYIVDNIGDAITEALSEGTDTVQSSISWTLGANLENLTLTGTAAIDGTGNALFNVLIGNSGNNSLNGGAGNDTLTGGLGSDQFVFGSGSAYTTVTFGLDTITDFSAGDQIVLSKSSFTALTTAAGGTISANSPTADFAVINGTDGAAAGLTARIVYNQTTGSLIYNQNGMASGLGSGGTFAHLTGNPVLTAANLLVQV